MSKTTEIAEELEQILEMIEAASGKLKQELEEESDYPNPPPLEHEAKYFNGLAARSKLARTSPHALPFPKSDGKVFVSKESYDHFCEKAVHEDVHGKFFTVTFNSEGMPISEQKVYISMFKPMDFKQPPSDIQLCNSRSWDPSEFEGYEYLNPNEAQVFNAEFVTGLKLAAEAATNGFYDNKEYNTQHKALLEKLKRLEELAIESHTPPVRNIQDFIKKETKE